MDLTSMQAALTSLKVASELVKGLRGADVSLEKAETKLRLADLTSALADLKMELASLQNVMLEQEATIRTLRDEAKFAGSMRFDRIYYWNVATEPHEGPFCSPCWDAKKLPARLIQPSLQDRGLWRCPVCGKHVRTTEPPEIDYSGFDGMR